MNYIICRRFKGKAICGNVNFPYGTEFQTNGNFIVTKDGKLICYTTSHTAHKYFARNDDGNGLERGKLTYAIAYGTRKKSNFRFTVKEQQMLIRDWGRFLKKDLDVILFNHDFFNADIEELQKLADILKIKV